MFIPDKNEFWQKPIKIIWVDDEPSFRDALIGKNFLSADYSIGVLSVEHFLEAYWLIDAYKEIFDMYIFDIVLDKASSENISEAEDLKECRDYLVEYLSNLHETEKTDDGKNKIMQLKSILENDFERFIIEIKNNDTLDLLFSLFDWNKTFRDKDLGNLKQKKSELLTYGGLYLLQLVYGTDKKIALFTAKGRYDNEEKEKYDKKEPETFNLSALVPFTLISPFTSNPLILPKGRTESEEIYKTLEDVCIKKALNIFKANPNEAKKIREKFINLENRKDNLSESILELGSEKIDKNGYKIGDLFVPFWHRFVENEDGDALKAIKKIIFSIENNNEFLTRIFKSKNSPIYMIGHEGYGIPTVDQIREQIEEINNSNLPVSDKEKLKNFLDLTTERINSDNFENVRMSDPYHIREITNIFNFGELIYVHSNGNEEVRQSPEDGIEIYVHIQNLKKYVELLISDLKSGGGTNEDGEPKHQIPTCIQITLKYISGKNVVKKIYIEIKANKYIDIERDLIGNPKKGAFWDTLNKIKNECDLEIENLKLEDNRESYQKTKDLISVIKEFPRKLKHTKENPVYTIFRFILKIELEGGVQ